MHGNNSGGHLDETETTSRLEVVQNSPGNEVTVRRVIERKTMATKAVNENDLNGINAKLVGKIV